jgi:hypothetical protein
LDTPSRSQDFNEVIDRPETVLEMARRHVLAVIATAAKGTAPAIEKAFSGAAPLQSEVP